MRVEVVTPNDYTGPVNGDLSSRRGRIESMEPRVGGAQVITSFVPLRRCLVIRRTLRSATQGRATSTMHFERYEQAPKNIAGRSDCKSSGRSQVMICRYRLQ
jgi:elongation factor G